MKIYQVEELVGITKKNIRFYEDEGLINPDRNPVNGYREYSLEDVDRLKKIKLLRKLSVPIDEIRLLQQNKLSFIETMEHQIDMLEKEQKNAQIMVELCNKMKESTIDFTKLDADEYLSQLVKMEKEGTVFVDIEKQDSNRKKKYGSIIAALVVGIIMMGSLIPGIVILFNSDEGRVVGFVLLGILIAVVTGIVAVLILRIKEINKGEEYEARKY